jgi:hypothetical protein
MKSSRSRVAAVALVLLVGGLGWYSVLSGFDLVPEIPSPRNRLLWVSSYLVQFALACMAVYAAGLVVQDIEAFAQRRADAGAWKPANRVRNDAERFAKWPVRLLVLWMVPVLYALIARVNS